MFIFDKITNLSLKIIFEGILLICISNYIFSVILYNIYLYDNECFIYTNPHMEDSKLIKYSDFLYYTFTSFFRLGYEITPRTGITRILCVLQLIVSFIIADFVIVQIIKS